MDEDLLKFWQVLNNNEVQYIMVGGLSVNFNGHNRVTDDLDIMTTMKGLERFSFDECYNKASVANIDGTKVPFLHINHLVENKRAVARPKDLDDVRELEKIIEERRKMGLD